VGAWKSSFSPESRDTVVGYYRKYTVGHGVGRDSCRGYRPWSCGGRAGVLPVLAGGLVVAVGGTVFHMWRGGVRWAPQVKVLRAPAGVGHAAVLNPLDGVQARAPGSLGDTWRSRTPRGGGPGLRLRVMGIPLRGVRGDTGPPPQWKVGPGPYV